MTGIVSIHPSVEGDTCFIALIQLGRDREECPIDFFSRYLTMTKLKYSILTIIISVVA